MGSFLKDKWPDLVILAITIPFIGAAIIWALDTGERIAVQENRTEQIIASLPDLRTRVAHQSVYEDFRSALLVSEPYHSNDNWLTAIQVLNAETGDVSKYVAKMQNEDDSSKVWEIYGMSMAVDRTAISFSAMGEMATTVQVKDTIPSGINSDASLISNVHASEIEEILTVTGATKIGDDRAPNIRNWPALVNETRMGVLQPPQP